MRRRGRPRRRRSLRMRRSHGRGWANDPVAVCDSGQACTGRKAELGRRGRSEQVLIGEGDGKMQCLDWLWRLRKAEPGCCPFRRWLVSQLLNQPGPGQVRGTSSLPRHDLMLQRCGWTDGTTFDSPPSSLTLVNHVVQQRSEHWKKRRTAQVSCPMFHYFPCLAGSSLVMAF
jgi:hypothetical protein